MAKNRGLIQVKFRPDELEKFEQIKEREGIESNSNALRHCVNAEWRRDRCAGEQLKRMEFRLCDLLTAVLLKLDFDPDDEITEEQESKLRRYMANFETRYKEYTDYLAKIEERKNGAIS